jgi:hypothetical protein
MVKTNDPGIANNTWLMSIYVRILKSVDRYLQQCTSSRYYDMGSMSSDNSCTIAMYAL